MLGWALLALTVGYVMAVPDLLTGAAYAAALGAGLGVLHVVQAPAWPSISARVTFGNLRGVASVVGIYGAAAGPLPFATWPPHVATSSFSSAQRLHWRSVPSRFQAR